MPGSLEVPDAGTMVDKAAAEHHAVALAVRRVNIADGVTELLPDLAVTRPLPLETDHIESTFNSILEELEATRRQESETVTAHALPPKRS